MNNFPISVSQIAEGMNNAGSMLAVANNSFEESIALLTASNATVQNISKASTGLRTIAARIRKTTTEDDDGEVVTEAKYQEMISALTKHKVSLTDLNGEYRSTYAIIKDIAAVWKDMTSMEQAAVVEALAGTRQQNIFASLMTQFGTAEEAIGRMNDSVGELQESYDIYLNSIQAHVNTMKAAFDELSMDFVNSAFAKGAVDILTAIIEVLDKLISKFGTLGTVLGGGAIIGIIKMIKAGGIISVLSKIPALSAEIAAATTGAALAGKSVISVLLAAHPALLGVVAIVAALTTGIILLKKAYDKANPSLQTLQKSAKEAKGEYDDLSSKIKENTKRIDELNEVKEKGTWNQDLQEELESLETQNAKLESQLELLRQIQEVRGRKVVAKQNENIDSYFNTGRSIKMSAGPFLGLYDAPNTNGYGGFLNAVDDYNEAVTKLTDVEAKIAEANKNAKQYSDEERELLNQKRKEYEEALNAARETIYAKQTELMEYREAIESADDEESIKNLKRIDEALDLIDKTTGTNRKTLAKFKSDFESLSETIRNKFKNGVSDLNTDEWKEFERWMRQCGYTIDDVYGKLNEWLKELDQQPSEFADTTRQNIDSLTSFRDELEMTKTALEAYNKAMEGGEKGDAAKEIADIYKGALEDIQAGKIDSNRMHAAAQLLFSSEQLTAMGNDLTKVAQAINSDVMRALFDPEGSDELDYGQRFVKYVRDHFGKEQGVWTDGNLFFYDSLSDVARAFGMSEAACAAFIDSLDAYGVSVMRSNEENTELVRQFNEIRNSAEVAGNTVAAVEQFIRKLHDAGRDRFDTYSILSDLQASGQINMDTAQLDATFEAVWRELEDLDKTKAEATGDLNVNPALENLRTLETAIASVIHDYYATVYLRTVRTSDSGPSQHSTSTRGAAAGGKSAGQRGGSTLVNELGPELISDDGRAFIANGGHPGFVNLSKNAIVFTADETEDILHGRRTVRAKARAEGTGTAGLRERLLKGGRTPARAGKVCPNCGKKVNSWAKTCRHCGYDFAQAEVEARNDPQSTTQTLISDPWQCAWCGNWNLGSDYWCQTCGATKDGGSPEYGNNEPAPVYEPEPQTYDPGWTCPYCKTWNSSIYSVCNACGIDPRTYRPDLEKSAQTPQKTVNVGHGFNITTPTSTGGNGYVGSCGGTNVGSTQSQSQTEPQKIDWIAVRINRLQRAVSDFQKIATSGLKKLSTRLQATKDEAAKLTEELNTMGDAARRYEQEAGSVSLDETIKEKVRNGTIDINEYDDEEVRKNIQAYQEWYEKMLDCQSAAEDLRQEIGQLYADDFANVQKDYENRLAQIGHQATQAQKDLQMSQAMGYLDNARFYEQQAAIEKENGDMLREELEALNERLETAMSSGKIEMGSEAWYDMKNQINAVEEAIADSNIALVQFEKTLRSLQWSYFDYAQERFGQISQEANFLLSLMGNDNMFLENGQFNQNGKATVGLHAANYDAFMAQADAYAQEIRKINEELANDPNDTELIARREQLLQLQQQSILSAEQEKDAVKSLAEQGVQKELESIRDLIDAYKDSLDSAKDLYEYQEKIADKSKTVAQIRKQLSAYANDDSEETRAKVQKLNEDLQKAEKDLRDAENDQSLADQKKLIDEVYSEYEELMNGRMDDVNALMREMIDMSNQNAGEILSGINQAAGEVGYAVSTDLKSILSNGVDYYSRTFSEVSSASAVLNKIYDNVAAMARASGAVTAYATGGLVDYTGLAAVHGTPGRPELMLNADDTKNFLEAAKMMRGSFTDGISAHAVESLGTDSRSGGDSFTLGPIMIDHVQDYNDFVRQLRDDPKFEKLVGTIAHDPLVGKSSFRKSTISF